MKTMAMLHQKAAITKLERLKVGALFMEMGTGKTRTYLDIGLRKIDQGKARHIVIVCPVSALQHTRDEVEKHCSRSVAIHNENYQVASATINLIGTESMSTSIRAVNRLAELSDGAVLIFDESHMLKNRDAKRTRHIRDIVQRTNYKFLSTGTPMSNGIEDLWSQFQILSPVILGYRRFSEFSRVHLQYALDEYGVYGKGNVVARFNTDLISNRIAPYTFQIKKADCFDLPQKTYSYATACMTDEMREIYAEAKRLILCGKEAFEASDATIYRLFTALHQISSGIVPVFMRDKIATFKPVKINLLLEQAQAIPAGKKLIVFCRYLAELSAAKEALTNAGYKTHTICGRTPVSQRKSILDFFKNDGDVLIATTATTGRALDISFAEYSIYLSNSFDYQERVQSEDRIHRYGMKGTAHYIDLRADCGIERKISRSLERKSNAARDFMEKIRYFRRMPDKQAREAIRREIQEL